MKNFRLMLFLALALSITSTTLAEGNIHIGTRSCPPGLTCTESCPTGENCSTSFTSEEETSSSDSSEANYRNSELPPASDLVVGLPTLLDVLKYFGL